MSHCLFIINLEQVGFTVLLKVSMSFEVRTVIGSQFQGGGAEMPKARFRKSRPVLYGSYSFTYL